MNTHRMIRLLSSLFALLALLTPTIHSQAETAPAVSRSGGEDHYIWVELKTSAALLTGDAASLTFTATPLIAAPTLTIRWTLPPGVELRGTPTETFSGVRANQPVTSARQVHFPGPGEYKVTAEAEYSPFPAGRFGAAGVLFFTVDGSGMRVMEKDPQAKSSMHSQIKTQVTQTPQPESLTPASPDAPCFTIRGTLTRLDYPRTAEGVQPAVRIPVRYARLNIREDDPVFDDDYGEFTTDENGTFNTYFCTNDGPFDDTLEFYIRFTAELKYNGHSIVEVTDSSWIDETYDYDTPHISSSGGTLVFNMELDYFQSEVFNIADAVAEGFLFWHASGGSASEGEEYFPYKAKAHWEPNYGDGNSYYDYFWDEITVADVPPDSDQWDDSVILVLYAQMLDDKQGCDAYAGGDHHLFKIVNDAWTTFSLGYADYFQSAARAYQGDPDSSWYLDYSTSTAGKRANFEDWDQIYPDLVTQYNESAVAAAFWDLYDNNEDGQDRIALDPTLVQSVYTSEYFRDRFQCTMDVFSDAWSYYGRPANRDVGAVFEQNLGDTYRMDAVQVASSPLSPASADSAPVLEDEWWQKAIYLVDNSATMAGAKLEAVKTVVQETMNDLESRPHGVEFNLETFDSVNSNQRVFTGWFYPQDLTALVQSLGASSAPDGGCEVNALRALMDGARDRYDAGAWLFTDGDASPSLPTVADVIGLLNDHRVSASFALLGGCARATNTEGGRNPGHEQELRAALQHYLGPMATDAISAGLAPYILAATGTGGQFLFVPPDQIDDAADILRAQLSHSAGAGRWSEYLSDSYTYRWDRLASWEYNWIDAALNPDWTGFTFNAPYYYYNVFSMPASYAFSFYGAAPSTQVEVFKNGYITIGSQSGRTMVDDNSPIPDPALPNGAIYTFWDQLSDIWPDLAGPQAPAGYGTVYAKASGDWYAIEYANYSGDGTFETLLNPASGEIRMQYAKVPSYRGSGSATIGLENANGSRAVQVSYNDMAGATDGMGYKFVLAPPQPSRTYTVTVDALMDGVGFLLTGFSGSFEALDVRYPDGTPVSCLDTANVLCLALGTGNRVQYVQANTAGRTGAWRVTVDAASPEATFSFTSLAASAIQVEGQGERIFSTREAAALQVSLGQPVNGNLVSGAFFTPQGDPFGAPFTLYDDGAHGDRAAGDGLFATNEFTPPQAGVANLRVTGTIDGQQFIRYDTVPYDFQPIKVEIQSGGTNMGANTYLILGIHNADSVSHCFNLSISLPPDWWINDLPPALCINANSASHLGRFLYLGAGATNDLPSGTSGEVVFSAVEAERGEIRAADTEQVTRYRPAAGIELFSPVKALDPGKSVFLRGTVYDDQGYPVQDIQAVSLSATNGSTIDPVSVLTSGGTFSATFTAGDSLGFSVVTAEVAGGPAAQVSIQVELPSPDQLSLSATPARIEPGGQNSILVASLTDGYGNPVAGQVVRIGVEGDGQYGTISGGEIITGTTDTNGQFAATLTSGRVEGSVGVRAELLVLEGGQYHPVLEARQMVAIAPAAKLFLPFVIHR